MFSKLPTITLRLMLLLVASLGFQRSWAQYEPLPFIILDAEERTLTDELGHVWDPEDGVWMPSTLGLPERNGLEVFVTNEVCADSVVYWSKSNRQDHRDLVSAFVNEYRQRGWMLHRHEGSYNLADINVIAEDIYEQYPSVIDLWNEQRRDPRGRFAVALVLHPQEGGPFESIILSEKVTKYDGDEQFCPVYYKNRTVLSNVETVRRRPRFSRYHGSSSSDGSYITFNEYFHIEGPTDRRLVIDRIISTCNFESDLRVIQNSYHSSEDIQSYAARLLHADRQDDNFSIRLRPFVFAGEDFQQQLERRTRHNLLRDTLEHYRIDTRTQMNDLLKWVEYKEVEPDTMYYYVPQALWKLLLRYRTFDPIRNRVRQSSPWIPTRVLESDTTRAYLAHTPTPVYREFQSYIEAGHAMADQHAVTSERDLREGYVARLNNMELYPIASQSRRVRVDHMADTVAYTPEPLMLTPEPVDTLFRYRWQMPDPNRYYQLRHVSYLHDFIHADTATTEECGCEREMPLQFMNLSNKFATFDCPPRRHIATDELVTFKPRARGELTDAVYHLALTFARNSQELDLNLGDNRAQMDSLVQKAYSITHDLDSRIQQVGITGISSPEGGHNLNLYLSRARSMTIIEKLREMGGPELGYAHFRIIKDSIAPWFAVADLIDRDMPQHHATAEHIRRSIAGVSPNAFKTQQERIGYSLQHLDPVIDEALKSLREVQVTYSYKAVLEATEQMIIERFRRAQRIDNLPPDYYYWILVSKHTTHDEKSRAALAVLESHASDVRRFTTDQTPSNSYGLVLPMAANFLAQDSIRLGRYNPEILAPFIDRSLYQGNIACYMNSDLETPVKFINLDVILYNQILTLTNVGTPEALAEAYDLMDMLNETPTLSSDFRKTYRPDLLQVLLDSRSGNFLRDERQNEIMRQSNIRNLYVVNFADIYRKVDGNLPAIQSSSDCSMRLQQCADSLKILIQNEPDAPSTLYFTAVTNLWQSDQVSGADKEPFVEAAVDALFRLFLIDNEPTFISRLQGDSYVRHIYRNPANRQLKRDIYLEAVERYITHTFNKSE